MSVFAVMMLAKVPINNPPSGQSGYQLSQCFSCHPELSNPQTLSQKKASVILKVRTGQMPPRISLSDAEKTQLIRQIQKVAK